MENDAIKVFRYYMIRQGPLPPQQYPVHTAEQGRGGGDSGGSGSQSGGPEGQSCWRAQIAPPPLPSASSQTAV
eukprot:6199869-Pleurochrysis_carterae.AAC.1